MMDAFQLIQNFFTRMSCQFCSRSFERDDIELIRQEKEGVFIVDVFCHRCNTHNGVAMVGVEAGDEESLEDNLPEGYDLGDLLEAVDAQTLFAQHETLENLPKTRRHKRYKFKDPELTKKELKRLARFKPVNDDDVLEAHHFFQNLGKDWMQFIPEEMRQSQTDSDTESPQP